MSDGHRKEAWQQIAILACPLWNQIRDPKKKPFQVNDFNPFAEKPKPLTFGFAELKDHFKAMYPNGK